MKLAEELLGSVEDSAQDELDEELVAELRVRAERVLSGQAGRGIPADEALADVERKLASE
ncbi:MAG TPA: hypothetical protein VFF73_15575 [Planctomycetota bacterium]|nr:hypothetical protein [Planctomycetota bacterium]